MAFSPDGALLLVVDVLGGALLINYTKRILLSTLRFKEKTHDIKFSPDGRYFAATCNNYVDVWHNTNFHLFGRCGKLLELLSNITLLSVIAASTHPIFARVLIGPLTRLVF